MQGEFDDTLRWPFHGEFKMIIIHPFKPEDSITEIMESKPEAAAFSKPTLPRNPKGFGYPDICSINKVFSQGYVKNDTLVCKILAKARCD
jgi:TNF receptor-associated factor 6